MRHDRVRSKNRQAGFSIPELLSVMIVSVMFSGLIIYFAIMYWRSTATLEADMGTLVSRLTAGDILRDAINESSGMITQNSHVDDNAHVPDPDIVSGDFWDQIHAVPKVIPVGASGSYTPVAFFRRPSVDDTKTIIMNGTQPYEDEMILYLNGTTKELMLRTLANPVAPSNKARTTCPAAAVTTLCPGDRIVAENIESVETRYFSRAGLPINHEAMTDPLTGEFIGPDFQSVEVVEFNLRLARKSKLKGGQDTRNQTVIRVALRSS